VRSFESDAGDNLNLIESYRKILAEVESAPPKPRKQDSMFTKLLASAKVTTCETDYDCNPGGRSWPRRCVSFVFSKICVDGDDDDFGGGGRIASMAMEPISVRVEDGYYDQDPSTQSGGGWSRSSW